MRLWNSGSGDDRDPLDGDAVGAVHHAGMVRGRAHGNEADGMPGLFGAAKRWLFAGAAGVPAAEANVVDSEAGAVSVDHAAADAFRRRTDVVDDLMMRAVAARAAWKRSLLMIVDEAAFVLGPWTPVVLYLAAISAELAGLLAFFLLSNVPWVLALPAAVVVGAGLLLLSKTGFKVSLARFKSDGPGDRVIAAVLLTTTILSVSIITLGLGSLRNYETEHARWEREQAVLAIVGDAGAPSAGAVPEPQPGRLASTAFLGLTATMALLGAAVLALGRGHLAERADQAHLRAWFTRVRLVRAADRNKAADYGQARTAAAAVNAASGATGRGLAALDVAAVLGERLGMTFASGDADLGGTDDDPRGIDEIAARLTGVARAVPGAGMSRAFPHLESGWLTVGEEFALSLDQRPLDAFRVACNAIDIAAAHAANHDVPGRMKHFDTVVAEVIVPAMLARSRRGDYPIEAVLAAATSGDRLPCGCERRPLFVAADQPDGADL